MQFTWKWKIAHNTAGDKERELCKQYPIFGMDVCLEAHNMNAKKLPVKRHSMDEFGQTSVYGPYIKLVSNRTNFSQCNFFLLFRYFWASN